MRKAFKLILTACAFSLACRTQQPGNGSQPTLSIRQDAAMESFSVFKPGAKEPILTQVAKTAERPYLHPIVAPDGKGVLTQYRPEHHPHQTGIYWGLKLVNGRDFFMKWQGDYWRKVSSRVINDKGLAVKWQTAYDLLDEKGNTTLTETATWSLQQQGGKYLLDLEWRGQAKVDVTFGKFYVGGLFLRMPWEKGTAGAIVNAAGQHNMEIEGQRAIWADVGMEIAGRSDWGHIAVFDHPDNKGFPIAWRTDTQLGLGPSRQIMGAWSLKTGETEVVRYRLVLYTGDVQPPELNRLWKEFICER